MESEIGDILTRYVYAAIDDIKADCVGEPRFSSTMYENYTNVSIKEAKNRKSLNKLYTPHGLYNSAYAILFTYFLKDLAEISLSSDDNQTSIAEKLSDCDYGKYIMKTAGDFGKVLESAYDTNKFITAKIEETMVGQRGNEIAITILSKYFNRYLKSVGKTVAEYVWYAKTMKFSYGMALAYMITSDLPRRCVDEIREDLECMERKQLELLAFKAAEKAAKTGAKPKPRRKKVTTDTAPVDVTTTDTATTDTTPTVAIPVAIVASMSETIQNLAAAPALAANIVAPINPPLELITEDQSVTDYLANII